MGERATTQVLKLMSGERSLDADCCVVVSMKSTIGIALLARDTPRIYTILRPRHVKGLAVGLIHCPLRRVPLLYSSTPAPCSITQVSLNFSGLRATYVMPTAERRRKYSKDGHHTSIRGTLVAISRSFLVSNHLTCCAAFVELKEDLTSSTKRRQ